MICALFCMLYFLNFTFKKAWVEVQSSFLCDRTDFLQDWKIFTHTHTHFMIRVLHKIVVVGCVITLSMQLLRGDIFCLKEIHIVPLKM